MPDFYHPDRVGQLYAPDMISVVSEARAASLTAAADDAERIMLVLVDAQVDFIHTDGTLSVPGAIDDTRRTIDWLLRNAGRVTTVAASLDSHLPIQIFFPTWWADAEGHHPDPYTSINGDDVRAGRWRPLYEHDWSVEYVDLLAEQAKKELMIWPYHTLIGTTGHGLTSALYEAVAYHSAARQTEPVFLPKGSIPRTEHYSILEPEVKVPDDPQGGLNTPFLDLIGGYDAVYIAGQAKSHCVLETITSMMRYFADRPDVIGRLHLLSDCTSSVAHPVIDFDALANETLTRYAANGLKLVTSADPLP